MKRERLKLSGIVMALTALAALTMTSCRKPDGEMLTVKRYEYQKTVKAVANRPQQMSIDMSVEFPTECAYSDNLENLQNFIMRTLFAEEIDSSLISIDTSVSKALKTRAEHLARTYVEDNSFAITDEYAEEQEMTLYFDAEYTLNAQVESVTDDDIMSYGVHTYNYYGGAHGLATSEYYAINLKTGETVTQAMLFDNLTETQLSELLLAALTEQSNMTREELEERGYDLSYVEGNDNFYLKGDSVYFYFNPYEIAPYSEGGITIALGR